MQHVTMYSLECRFASAPPRAAQAPSAGTPSRRGRGSRRRRGRTRGPPRAPARARPPRAATAGTAPPSSRRAGCGRPSRRARTVLPARRFGARTSRPRHVDAPRPPRRRRRRPRPRVDGTGARRAQRRGDLHGRAVEPRREGRLGNFGLFLPLPHALRLRARRGLEGRAVRGRARRRAARPFIYFGGRLRGREGRRKRALAPFDLVPPLSNLLRFSFAPLQRRRARRRDARPRRL